MIDYFQIFELFLLRVFIALVVARVVMEIVYIVLKKIKKAV